MAQGFRLPSGGRIDRAQALSFSFDGRSYRGHPGDTLASALLANGVRLMGRSFKYHRPRGVWGAGSEEPNALVELRTGARQEPNTRATVIELHEGLAARSQNRWPSLRFDLMAVNSLVTPMLAAGFYYKTFMWPASFWEKLYEPMIRRAAGLGRAAREADPDRYERSHLFCDVLVIGAGPTGLMAALTAGRTGARVVLIDEDAEPGGRLLSERTEIDGAPAMQWTASVLDELRAMPDVTILPRTTLFGVFDHGVYGAIERVADHLPTPPADCVRQRYWRIIARRSVLAAGAIERPIAFGGNDRPGVMAASAVRSYVNRWAVTPGRRAVLFTAGDDGWRTLDDLHAAGVQVAAVIDARRAVPDGLAARARTAGAQLVAGGAVRGTQGGSVIRSVEAMDDAGRSVVFPADLLAVSGGWNPTVALTCHQGGRPVWNRDKLAFVPGTPPNGMAVAGAANGAFGLHECLQEGAQQGLAAADAAGFPGQLPVLPRAEDEPSAVTALFHISGSRGKAFVDFQHDVAASDIALAEREGYRSVEHTKRYTTLGMATDQGKTANVVGLAILAERTGRTIEETGTTMFRPPYTPVAVGALVGAHTGMEMRPTRYTPTHDWSAANGASFVETGAWQRAQWYCRPGEAGWRDSVDREVLTVRQAVGFCDVSTLGKIEVVGPDAAALLDFVYTNTMSALAVGRMRYGLMLREDGFVLDDGTCARLAADRFMLTTTTANAARVLQHMEFCHQVLRPELDVGLLSVTDRWAQVAIAGPKSRQVVQALLDMPDAATDAALPFMAHAAPTVCGGVEARLYRVSFSGELAYELAVPADYGSALMQAIAERGEPFGIAAYGTEALGVLRIEKGHPAGNELNGQTTARDLAMTGLLAKRKDYVGRALQGRPALVDPARPVLVGIRPVERGAALRGGAHFLAPGAAAAIGNDLGHVTSVAFSPSLGHMIGLGLLADGKARIGSVVRAYDPVRNGDTEVEVCSPSFIDPEGARLRG
jgi:methylglutamate dehydrogenase subunit C